MCLIAYQPAGSRTLDKSVFHNGWRCNKDGAGYMFAVDGVLIIRKPFWSKKKLWKAYTADHAKYGEQSPFVVHFRYSTHGVNDELNTHPHTLDNGNAALVHNGMLWDFEGSDFRKSDTVHFCGTVLAHRTAEQLISPEFTQWLADLIGPNNKLVLMDRHGGVSIVNDTQGEWDNGNWFSNTGYKAKPISLPPKWEPRQDYSDRWNARTLFCAPGDDAEVEAREDALAVAEFEGRDIDAMDDNQWRQAVAAMDRD